MQSLGVIRQNLTALELQGVNTLNLVTLAENRLTVAETELTDAIAARGAATAAVNSQTAATAAEMNVITVSAAQAQAALAAGFHVVCDKPMTYTTAEARRLVRLVERSGLLYALTHNYTGYPLVKEMRERVRGGSLGLIRKVVVEYLQGWLTTPLERSGQKQAAWRTDPRRSGGSGCIGDIGTHAENLAEYVTGLQVKELCADLKTVVRGRWLEDDGSVLLHFTNGAQGLLYASQVSAGEENDLRLRVYGEKGGLEWSHANPNILLIKWLDRPTEVVRAGANYAYLSKAGLESMRLPGGHPEGFIEGFANIYRSFAGALRRHLERGSHASGRCDFPDVHDSLRGMLFIETVLQSARTARKWTRMKA